MAKTETMKTPTQLLAGIKRILVSRGHEVLTDESWRLTGRAGGLKVPVLKIVLPGICDDVLRISADRRTVYLSVGDGLTASQPDVRWPVARWRDAALWASGYVTGWEDRR
jgi:hypothetical protein